MSLDASWLLRLWRALAYETCYFHLGGEYWRDGQLRIRHLRSLYIYLFVFCQFFFSSMYIYTCVHKALDKIIAILVYLIFRLEWHECGLSRTKLFYWTFLTTQSSQLDTHIWVIFSPFIIENGHQKNIGLHQHWSMYILTILSPMVN